MSRPTPKELAALLRLADGNARTLRNACPAGSRGRKKFDAEAERFRSAAAALSKEAPATDERKQMAEAVRFDKLTQSEHRPDEEAEGCLQCGCTWPCMMERAARILEAAAPALMEAGQ